MYRIVTAACAAALLLGASPAFAQNKEVVRREVGNLVMENVPESTPELREQLRRYQNARSASFQDWLDDGSMLVTTRFGQTAQLHHVAAPGAARTQLTFFDEPIAATIARPGDNRFVFIKDVGGAEYYQAWLAGLSGTHTLITQPDTRNDSMVFSRDGKLLVMSRVGKGDPNNDLLVMNPEDAASRRVVLEGEGTLYPLDISRDNRRVLYQRYYSSTASQLFVLDLQTGVVTEVNPRAEDIAYGSAEFAGDGRRIVLTSNEGSDVTRLEVHDLATGRSTPLTPELKWDVEAFDLSDDGRVLAYSVNEDGFSRVVVQDFATRRALPQPKLPKGVVGALDFSPKGDKLAIGMSTPTSNGDVWSWDVLAGQLTRWTWSELGGLDAAELVDAGLIRFKSFDGLSVPAFIYKPKAAAGKLPVIINIHGGPEAQVRPSFSSTIQYWVNELGAAVITPNVRGSDGYGKAYLLMDNGPLRENSVKDIGALLDWIATQPDLDPSRVVVHGGSYGGYMVLSSLAHYNDRLAGGIDIVGISDFTTFLTNTEGYRRDNRRAEYGDERDPAMKAVFAKIAPLNMMDRVSKPMLVIQGANDPRVPKSEADQVVAKVRAQGGDVWYLVAKDEGHGFRKKQNTDAQREIETLFLRKVLRLQPAG